MDECGDEGECGWHSVCYRVISNSEMILWLSVGFYIHIIAYKTISNSLLIQNVLSVVECVVCCITSNLHFIYMQLTYLK